ncbi:hypothetical protein LTR85_009130 [Meristemomyces frigidus]|nr:hypothetical protein LTR85_009130 [Meristemomyces frigidus]
MQECDPFFFQGCDPATDSFMFFSFQDTPANNDRDNQDTYDCQVIVSWPYRAEFLGRSEPTETPATSEERLRLMKEITRDWASPFRDVVQDMPSTSTVQAIRLEDWPPEEGSWENFDGRATLVGDAAHAMTMYRGEAANHGITDVARWLDFHLPVLKSKERSGGDLKGACDAYEREMIARTHLAVLASRQACLDAHDHERVNERSPLVSKRAPIATA